MSYQSKTFTPKSLKVIDKKIRHIKHASYQMLASSYVSKGSGIWLRYVNVD